MRAASGPPDSVKAAHEDARLGEWLSAGLTTRRCALLRSLGRRRGDARKPLPMALANRFGHGAAMVGPLIVAVTAVIAVGLATAAPVDGRSRPLRVNHMQVIGTHNSFHLEASPAESAIRRNAGVDDSPVAYSHAPLSEQLESQGVRQLELDVFADPEGGRYAAPRLRELAGEPPYDAAMLRPGTKVLHIQDYDYRSNCLTLVQCLREVRTWSRAHPRHVPLAIIVDLKDARLLAGLPATVPRPWTAARMDELDAEIRSVFRRREIISPDDVRRGRRSLRTAVLRDGWPTLRRARGKVMFLMANRNPYRSRYLAGHPSLRNRVLFTNSAPGRADAAFVEVNDPREAGAHRIRRLVRRGFMVRTRADADTVEARANDLRRATRALNSGAHWVSTDYPAPGMASAFASPYVVGLPAGGVGRCNPVTAPAFCRLRLRE